MGMWGSSRGLNNETKGLVVYYTINMLRSTKIVLVTTRLLECRSLWLGVGNTVVNSSSPCEKGLEFGHVSWSS